MGSIWLSATSVSSRVAAGTGTYLPAIFSFLESRIYEVADILFVSFSSPSLFRSNQIVPTSASESLFIAGILFCTQSVTPQTRMQGSSQEATLWLSDSSLQPRIIAGVGMMTGVKVTSSLQIGMTNSSIQYDAPRVIDTFRSGYFPVTSEFIVDVQMLVGLSTFDTSCKMRVGKSASEWTLWISESSLSGRISSGVGAGHMVGKSCITVQSQSGIISGAMSYNAAKLTSASPRTTAASGSMSATVFGNGFGVTGFSGCLRASMISIRSALTALEGSVWRSDSSLGVRVAMGIGVVSLAFATVGCQLGIITNLLSYNTAIITATSIGNTPASGSVSLSVLGRSYGVVGFSGCLRSSMALSLNTATAFEGSDWMSESSLSGRVACGVGAGLRIVFVTIGEQSGSSMTSALSYNFASLTSAHPCDIAQSGSMSATMIGAGFGVAGFSGRLRASIASRSSSATMFQSSVWRSDSSLTGRFSSGVRAVPSGAIVFVTVGRQRGSITDMLTYNAAGLRATNPCNVAASGSMSATVIGREFGNAGFSGRLRASIASSSNSATGAESSIWMSDSSCSGRIASGVGAVFGVGIVFVTFGNQFVSVTSALSYNNAVLSAINPCNAATSGSRYVEVLGRGFGATGFIRTVRAGLQSSGASVYTWLSDSSTGT